MERLQEGELFPVSCSVASFDFTLNLFGSI